MLADVALAGDADRMVASLGAQTDAVIGYLGRHAPGWIERLGSAPVVELDPVGEPVRGAVLLDPAGAVEALADRLAAVGVRAPVVLDSPGPDSPSRRAVLMRDALARRGIRAEIVLGVPATAEDAAAATAGILAAADRPDAVLAFNDVMALGVLSACRRAGVDVPGEVRVTGFDGLALGGLVAPTLTTLAVDLDEVAGEALDLAVAMIAGEAPPAGPGAHRTVRHRLVVRESA
jgi:DNA-binding LacI/PurR family transcriptional regulator